MRLSLCMIARDEERHLARCLTSAAGVVDEIVLVDTGSTDRTVEVARGFGADVYHEPWRDDFAAARNASLARATGDWILVLDADEALDPGTAAALRAVAQDTRADGVQLIQRSLTAEAELFRYHDLPLTRLFRNRAAYRYEQPIHEQIRPSILRAGGTVAPPSPDAPLVIVHYGYADPMVQGGTQGGGTRAARNRALLEAAVAATPHDAYLHYQLGVTCRSLGDDTRAARHLRLALALDRTPGCGLGPDVRAAAYARLAQIELAADRYADALALAERCLALAPDDGIAMYVAALSHLFLGRGTRAHPYLARLRRAADCSPSGLDQLDRLLAYCETFGVPVASGA